MHTMYARNPFAMLLALSHTGAALAISEDVPSPPPLPDPLPLAENHDSPSGNPAQTPATAQSLPSPSQNVAVNLIVLLVKKGQLTQEEGLALIHQAEAEAKEAQAKTEGDLPPPAGEENVSVNYVPQTVRNGIRDEIKQELMAEARKGNWNDSETPDWTKKIRPFGDIRVRYEGLFFPSGNDNTGSFPNFNAINTGAPFDTSGTLFSPQYNVDQNRERARLRARIGADIMLGDGFSSGFRLATGDSNSPVSTNQSLGSSGGDFSKYSIWLDRAFLAYNLADNPDSELSILAGRFDNPFFSTEIMWDEDIGFDGLAARGKAELYDGISTFFAAGLFPVYNTDLNFASNQPSKFRSQDKWLTGAQAGIEWKINDHLKAKLGAAYYDFQNIEGKLSSPFVPLSQNDAGDTDATRPSFAQRGNTYMAIRNITPTAANDFGTKYQYQYYGLATPFHVLAATARLEYDGYDPIRFVVTGEYLKNIAFDAGKIGAKAVNNLSGGGAFDGGDSAWNLAFQFGHTAMEKRGDWLLGLGYRYVESDAVVDGFTDSDFGGGGTNVRGFTLGGAMAMSPNVRLGLKWMSSDEIAGPTLHSDTLQFDINAKF